jgi:hypothetical protein
MTKTSRIAAAAAAIAIVFSAGAALAQNWQGQPNYGSVQLSAGFTPDPYNVQVVSGGPINATQSLGSNCVGYIANNPDFDLYWTAGNTSRPLVISVDSQQDTTLVVRMPDGRWVCEDDGGFNSLNPGLRIDNPQSGLYDIWVGTYGSTNNYNATLSISELSSH